MQYDYTKKLCENDVDFSEIYSTDLAFRKGMKFRISSITDRVKLDYRENLICKIKKVTDTFEINDDAFFRASFLYDYHDRLKAKLTPSSNYRMKNKLEDLFLFGPGEEEELRKYKYVKFFEALAIIIIITKYNEKDSNSPKCLDLLKFYWAEKLNLEIIK